MKELTFTRQTVAIGRNGRMKCTGIVVSNTSYPENSVMIEPINTKGIGHCEIVIPKEDVMQLCYELEEMIQQKYRIKLNHRDDNDTNQINGYLAWNGEIVEMSRRHAIKKAKLFDGRIEKV